MPRYWLKITGDKDYTIKSDWRPDYERWIRERHGSTFPRRPTIRAGDFLVLYAAGSPKVFGKGKVYAVEIATSDPRRGDHERWPFLVETVLHVAGPRLEECPNLDDIGVSTMAVRRQSHIRLSLVQGTKAAWLIARAAEGP
jgi:hypothetical protein